MGDRVGDRSAPCAGGDAATDVTTLPTVDVAAAKAAAAAAAAAASQRAREGHGDAYTSSNKNSHNSSNSNTNNNKNNNNNNSSSSDNDEEDDDSFDYVTPKVPPCYGGARGTGSHFVLLSPDEYARLERREAKYKRIVQKLLDRADIVIGGDRPHDVVVHHPLLYRTVLRKGSLGLGDAYVDGWWDTRDFYALDAFFVRVLRGGLEYYFPNNAKELVNIAKARLFNDQTRRKSRRVGLQHYDIGNAFFESMLGPTMQYSCAYWQQRRQQKQQMQQSPPGEPHAHTGGDDKDDKHSGAHLRGEGTVVRRLRSLDEAQLTKMRLIGEKLRLRPGMHVLDVGCGWGTLAQFLCREYKVKVTGITISEQQRRDATARVRDTPEVTIQLQDYRDAAFCVQFDRIVSVGMFEHVGPKNYRLFFKHMRRLLNDRDPDAVMLLHTVGSKTTMHSSDAWYRKYIFPGGCLPCIQQIAKAVEGRFVVEDWHNFGYFYGLTLLAWRRNFLRTWAAGGGGGGGAVREPTAHDAPRTPLQLAPEQAESFFRTFYYYLSSSAGAFLARDLQLWQVILSPHGVPRYIDAYRP